jgi:hypothetical protein
VVELLVHKVVNFQILRVLVMGVLLCCAAGGEWVTQGNIFMCEPSAKQGRGRCWSTGGCFSSCFHCYHPLLLKQIEDGRFVGQRHPEISNLATSDTQLAVGPGCRL